VAQKSFIVRDLSLPIPTVNNYKNEDAIPLGEVPTIKSMKAFSNEALLNEDVYIAGFEFKLIYNDHTSITKPINNIGSSFNSNILDLLKEAKTGDIMLFDKIRSKSSLGTERTLTGLTLSIKK